MYPVATEHSSFGRPRLPKPWPLCVVFSLSLAHLSASPCLNWFNLIPQVLLFGPQPLSMYSCHERLAKLTRRISSRFFSRKKQLCLPKHGLPVSGVLGVLVGMLHPMSASTDLQRFFFDAVVEMLSISIISYQVFDPESFATIKQRRIPSELSPHAECSCIPEPSAGKSLSGFTPLPSHAHNICQVHSFV